MKSAFRMMLAGACVAGLAGIAGAQAQPVGARATLYEYPNFQGRSTTVYRSNSNLADTNFNDMAQSGRFDGDWTVCTDSGFRGQCQRVSGDVPNLNQLGVGRSISSLQQGGAGGEQWSGGDNRGPGYPGDRGPGYQDDRYPGGAYPGGAYPGAPVQGGGYGGPGYSGGVYTGGGGYGGGGYGAGVPGRSVIFFPRPLNDGQDIAAYDRQAADWFCRQQGLGAAVYWDVSQRGRGFRWQGGGFAINAPVLRDVVCRRH